MRFDRRAKQIVGIFAICGVLTVSGHLYLDIRLARFIRAVVGDDFLCSSPISKIPDLLFSMVCSLTCMSWAARLYLSTKEDGVRTREFLEYVGSALPVAFLLKTILKDVFGRTNARLWLIHPCPLGFHWFHGGGSLSGFPSGHMVVFTVLMIGIGRYFPRWRTFCPWLLLALALALMITQYHFLSDIAAGVLLGVIVDLVIGRGLPFLRYLAGRKEWQSRPGVL
ncbi:MAG: phosphatase PAP2 family protein [Syntrophobacteraceae bacterium]|nr:phosphatase PAP2 family protein [Syntrophobacteraceae bacterium]